ncbi:heterogeneous nuclear ribonucleoprotein H3 [Octopus bimaculoides]|uniref:RRM domain-containing protein n=1 Tax=Octopus bimaculoides TaxID=37653 RepID=A0A0L8HMS6_OCTBM|nr:heterogeneous nuclear ribonucleoprotein H3 [Octopus bimaculoides]XP_014771008.1 heterogeneous nuclear ribonucleoprotein H3 [Octopus bimaculoides]|eukprot:XP_014771007.1 PREDICTED: heterogeneous nuclear ribonucleoprotein H3-like [Octopus bimaculoides]
MQQSQDQHNDDEGCVVRLRGLPWAATASDVLKFFEGCRVYGEEMGVHFTYSREGRPSGEAFVEFVSNEDKELALKKNNAHMGQRYIEVFRSKKSEMDWVIKRAGSSQVTGQSDAVVRMRGLPFGCSKEEIAQFFTGLEIVPNGIMLPEDRQGRSTGEAYVQYASPEIAKKALDKHMARLGHRYIEIFPSTLQEAYANVGPPRQRNLGFMAGNRPGPYDRNDRFGGSMNAMGGGGFAAGGYGRGRGGRNVKGFFEDDYDEYGGGYGGGMGFGGLNRRGNLRPQTRGRLQGGSFARPKGATPGSMYVSKSGHSVHMRGLPFQAIEQDIRDFFRPLDPIRMEFEYRNNRPTGEADVDFSSHQDAVSSMERHKNYIQDRYIELFLNSTPDGRGDGGGVGGGYGDGPMGSGRFGGIGGGMGGGGMGGGGGMNNYGGSKY